jgi:endonuclease V-like protein UPF0215 family
LRDDIEEEARKIGFDDIYFNFEDNYVYAQNWVYDEQQQAIDKITYASLKWHIDKNGNIIESG